MTSEECFKRAAWWQQFAAKTYQTYEYHMNEAKICLAPHFLSIIFRSVDRIHAEKHYKKASDALGRMRVYYGTASEYLELGIQLKEMENNRADRE